MRKVRGNRHLLELRSPIAMDTPASTKSDMILLSRILCMAVTLFSPVDLTAWVMAFRISGSLNCIFISSLVPIRRNKML